MLFDLTRFMTLKSLDEWAQICRAWDDDLPILFLGTKLDLKDQISVDEEYAREYQEKLDCFDFLKVSSKNGTNVEKAFETLTLRIIDRLGIQTKTH